MHMHIHILTHTYWLKLYGIVQNALLKSKANEQKCVLHIELTEPQREKEKTSLPAQQMICTICFSPLRKDELCLRFKEVFLYYFILLFFISLNFLFILTGLCSGKIPALLHYFPAASSAVVTWVYLGWSAFSSYESIQGSLIYPADEEVFFNNWLLGSRSLPRLHAVILRCSLIALKSCVGLLIWTYLAAGDFTQLSLCFMHVPVSVSGIIFEMVCLFVCLSQTLT